MARYIIGILAVIGLIIILIILLIPSGPKTANKNSPLVSYASSNATVRLTIDGPINADQIHTAVQIEVGKNNVTYLQLTGYNGQVVKLQTYPNTEASYDVFLHALFYAGYSEGNTSSRLRDEKGVCALGDRYVFELISGTSDIQRFWATNCGGLKTYNGNVEQTLTLFENQVPDYENLIQGIDF